jgi:hypothetical protein
VINPQLVDDTQSYLAAFPKNSPPPLTQIENNTKTPGSHLRYYYETESAALKSAAPSDPVFPGKGGSFNKSQPNHIKSAATINTASVFHETMKHRNELMKREVQHLRTIKDLRKEIKQMGEQMDELKASMKVLLQFQSVREGNNTFNNDMLRRAAHGLSTT